MVVDDDTGCRSVLAFLLESAGYEVLHAGDGADAIVLDLMMPRVDGYAVLSHLRDSPDLSAIPVVVVGALGVLLVLTGTGKV